MARELIFRLDIAQGTRQLSDAESALRKRMKVRVLDLASLERTIARQRSRIQHLSEGDANTAYFHLIARGRKRRNFIPSLSVHGHIVADKDGMEMAMFEHFSSMFGTAPAGQTTINFTALGIQPVHLDELEADIDADEAWAVPADRAPGPDGFTSMFYKTAWLVIKDDVIAAIQCFTHGDCRGLDRLNNALIVLLPKKVGAYCPAAFRPITMIHSFAKLVSKILAMRLAPRLNELIDKNQNAFIRSRTIQDNFKFVQRASVLIRNKKIPTLLLKLDISKSL